MKALKNWMERTGTTQAALGAKIGAGQSTVSMLVNGERKPSYAMMHRIMRVTGMSPSEFFGEGRKRRK